MSDQIALPLRWPEHFTPDRFLVSQANEAALHHLEKWSTWPVRATVLVGPRRSGRSLLGRLFVERTGGRLFDDAEEHDEEELFHAWNRAQDDHLPLLLIADRSPPDWAPTLPDLATRLAVTPVTQIRPPDDELFGSLLELHFADRGMHLAPDARRYLTERCERSYYAAERLVQWIDRYAMANRARLTIPTIRAALEQKGQAA
ncbi:DnaA/Hda family protein [Sphingomicrobium sp. XHP0235]|uniref:HdaA/DnaA family protein n=1 Tax=Sphingomicrobium aquimarinum TaxID=3133971 RepID=UPI0031FF412D